MSSQEALYDSMVADVVTITNRPDLAEETKVAVRTATLSVHMLESFPRDVSTELVKLPNAFYVAGFDTQVLFPRFRGVSTIRILDSSFAPVEFPAIDVVELGDIYDPIYGTLKNNIAYAAGTSLNVRCAVPAYGCLVEYFHLPQVRRESYNSWIAQLYPEPIIYKAASIVLATNGNEEKSKSLDTYCKLTLNPQLTQNFLTSAMR